MSAPIRRVFFATDAHPNYLFLTPLTCRLWRAFGYRPMVALAGAHGAWQTGPRAIAVAEMRACEAELLFIEPIPGYRDSTVAQVSRLYAGALDLPDDAYVLTSDADMWPISRAYFDQLPSDKAMHVLYANAYEPFAAGPKFPICYLGASIAVWRQIMGIQAGDLRQTLQRELDKGLGAQATEQTAWNYDEVMFGQRLAAWPGYPHRCELRQRDPGTPPLDRIDRSFWFVPEDLTDKIDAHLPRPAQSEEYWSDLRGLLGSLLPADEVAAAEAYRQRFLAAC